MGVKKSILIKKKIEICFVIHIHTIMTDKTKNKIQEVELEIVQSKEQVSVAINSALERGDNLEELETKSKELEGSAKIFVKKTKQVKWKAWRDKMTNSCILWTVGIVIVVIIVLVIIAII